MRTTIDIKKTMTWQIWQLMRAEIRNFLKTLGNIGKDTVTLFKYVLKLSFNRERIIEQSSRFAIDSLPITLTIVGMTSIIVAMQIAPELVKQGGGDYMGMLAGMVMVRELGAITAGFAIISMIGSSYASEIASMSVTEQLNAMKVLDVNPIEYLVVPRFMASILMMPLVVIVSSTIGIFLAGIVSHITAGISFLNYINSLWHGIHVKDIFVTLLKSSFFGGTITIISCSCGYSTRGGAKEVGMSTTQAVVWSFLAIAMWDFIFALVFYM